MPQAGPVTPDTNDTLQVGDSLFSLASRPILPSMRGIGHPRGVDPEEGERCGCSVVTCEWMREDMVSPALVFTSIIRVF